jgi:hypothetical protein
MYSPSVGTLGGTRCIYLFAIIRLPFSEKAAATSCRNMFLHFVIFRLRP